MAGLDWSILLLSLFSLSLLLLNFFLELFSFSYFFQLPLFVLPLSVFFRSLEFPLLGLLVNFLPAGPAEPLHQPTLMAKQCLHDRPLKGKSMKWHLKSCPHLQSMGPMTTSPLNPANSGESTSQILFGIWWDSFLPGVKLLQRQSLSPNEILTQIATLVISVLTTPGSISWTSTPVPSSSKARDCKIWSMKEKVAAE